MPSLNTNLKNAPAAIAHNNTTPYLAPPTVADTTSPEPMPVAATTRPGPASLRKLTDGREVSDTGRLCSIICADAVPHARIPRAADHHAGDFQRGAGRASPGGAAGRVDAV